MRAALAVLAEIYECIGSGQFLNAYRMDRIGRVLRRKAFVGNYDSTLLFQTAQLPFHFEVVATPHTANQPAEERTLPRILQHGKRLI